MEAMIASHGGGSGFARADTFGPPYGLFNVRSLGDPSIKASNSMEACNDCTQSIRGIGNLSYAWPWDSDLWGILAKAFIRTCPRLGLL